MFAKNIMIPKSQCFYVHAEDSIEEALEVLRKKAS